MKVTRTLALALCAAMSLPLFARAEEDAAPGAGGRVTEAVVKSVVNGDTIVLESGDTVRYIGINAPKTKYPKMDVYYVGKESFEFNKKLVGGKTVRLEYDTEERDATGRILAYVYVGEEFVNAELVKHGWAFAAAYPPNVKYQEDLAKYELEAREGKLGIWAEKKKIGKAKPSVSLELEAEVEEVVAGDTVRLTSGQLVRMIGITCPKYKNIPAEVKQSESYYGKDSFDFTRDLLTGKKIRLLLDVQQHDMEGRMLGYVFAGDVFVNAELVKKGLAEVTTYPPNVRYEDLFIDLEKEAKDNKAGMWSAQ